MDSTIQLILLIVLLVLIMLSGVFSSSETALMSLSKIKLRQMEEDGVKNINILSKIMEDSSRLLSTILVANNIVNIGASSIATALFMEWVGASGVPLATLIMTILILIFGEITPKSISSNNPEKMSIFVCRFIYVMMIIFTPVVFVLDFVRKMIFKILGIKENNDQPLITEEDLITYVNVSHEEGVIEIEEKEIIHNVFAFGDLQAKHAMVNRMDMVAVEKDISYAELVQVFEKEKFTRIPIYEGSIDSIVGIINIKDIAFLDDNKKANFNIMDYSRNAFFTYEFKSVSDLLEELKIEKTQMAIVVDEYGATAGLLTVENLLEELVGDITDEFDEDELEIVKLSEFEYRVKGYVNLKDVNDELGLSLESEDVDSLAGYIISHFKGFPEKGEEINIGEFTFLIDDVEKNKINSIIIKNNLKLRSTL